MTEAEQFLTEFLGVQENDFPITLNLRLYAEALEAYHAHKYKLGDGKEFVMTAEKHFNTRFSDAVKLV